MNGYESGKDENARVTKVTPEVHFVMTLLIFVISITVFKFSYNQVIPAITKNKLGQISWMQSVFLMIVTGMLFKCCNTVTY